MTQHEWYEGKDERLIPYGDTNLGTPLQLVHGSTVPTELFFVRSNYTIPQVDKNEYRLRIHGNVDRPLDLTYADIAALPARTISAFLECAGNSRTRLQPAVEGTQWRDDAVGCAEWTGVPLRHLLELAGVQPDSVDVVSQGGDDPAMRRGLPLHKALDEDTLVVWQMNGRPLLRAHGAPVRLLVPGWAGIASTKWLVGLELVNERFDGYWNAQKYVRISPSGQALGRVEDMPVKSVIANPATGSTLTAGPVSVRGYAWSGCAPVTRVEVSCDGGSTYAAAHVEPSTSPRAWVTWTFEYVAAPGAARLLCRATDATGRTQPDAPVWNAHGYQIDAVSDVTFDVSGAAAITDPAPAGRREV